MKRTFDIVVSLVALVMLGLPLAIIGLLIWWREGRPVFFLQARPGLHEVPFNLVKFRTMQTTYDEAGGLLPDGIRLTTLGRFLRSTSLDELPEFWNVLKGEMSIVGPRPLLMEYLPLYSEGQRRRHEMRPGITGWAQVNGRNAISWEQKFELDVWYVDHWTFWLDIKILLLTVRSVVLSRGITQMGHATAEKFRGSVE